LRNEREGRGGGGKGVYVWPTKGKTASAVNAKKGGGSAVSIKGRNQKGGKGSHLPVSLGGAYISIFWKEKGTLSNGFREKTAKKKKEKEKKGELSTKGERFAAGRLVGARVCWGGGRTKKKKKGPAAQKMDIYSTREAYDLNKGNERGERPEFFWEPSVSPQGR